MLRITRTDIADGRTILQLEGQLIGPWVHLLRETWEACNRNRNGLVILDAADVRYASREGVELLRELHDRRAVRISCSPFLGELLGDACEVLPQDWRLEEDDHGLR